MFMRDSCAIRNSGEVVLEHGGESSEDGQELARILDEHPVSIRGVLRQPQQAFLGLLRRHLPPFIGGIRDRSQCGNDGEENEQDQRVRRLDKKKNRLMVRRFVKAPHGFKLGRILYPRCSRVKSYEHMKPVRGRAGEQVGEAIGRGRPTEPGPACR